MPAFERDGIRINYEVHGAGAPLLMVMGLGGSLEGWRHQVPELARDFQVIVFDNRGVGQSSVPGDMGLYSMSLFADDAAAVLDDLGVERAHVFGISMGGMISQHIALRHPRRVRGLVLGCTTPAGPRAVQPEMWVLELLLSGSTKTARQAIEDSIAFNFSPAFAAARPDMIQEYIEHGMAQRMPPVGFAGQWQAILAHETYHDLAKIDAPTLVQHGTADALVPFANGKLIAETIAGARLQPIEGAGHVYFIEQAPLVNASVREFLQGLDR